MFRAVLCKPKEDSVRSSVRVFGIIALTALLLACGSKPPGVGGSNGEGGTGGDGSSQAGDNGFIFTDDPTQDPTTVVCRTEESCEALECGPIADGCGAFIQCGGCEAPASCGGGGVPSHCGVPGSTGTGGGGNCEASTCASLAVSCGQVGDGCGGVLTCGTCTGTGEECVLGQCQPTSDCQPLSCDDYPEAGRCGPVSDGCSGILNCPFTPCADNERPRSRSTACVVDGRKKSEPGCGRVSVAA